MPLPPFIANPGLKASKLFYGKFGYEIIDRKSPVPGIKDAAYYRPFFSPWLMEEWAGPLHAGDPRSLVAMHGRYILYNLALDATRRCSGDLAECGVYKGGTAKILAEVAPDRPLHLFDTYAGMPETDPLRDWHKAGDFADTSLESVRAYLAGHPNVAFVQGLIPGTLEAVRDREFAFVHIDLDIYAAILAACDFFYPRMQTGGVMLFDDYGYADCAGARAAVDEFFADKREVKICIESGQCWLHKLPSGQ